VRDEVLREERGKKDFDRMSASGEKRVSLVLLHLFAQSASLNELLCSARPATPLEASQTRRREKTAPFSATARRRQEGSARLRCRQVRPEPTSV
jgi:hypothetical protein